MERPLAGHHIQLYMWSQIEKKQILIKGVGKLSVVEEQIQT